MKGKSDELAGYWWIPGRKKHQKPGVLTTKAGEPIRLKTIGKLIPGFSLGRRQIDRNVPAILGTTSEVRRIALEGCYLTRASSIKVGHSYTDRDTPWQEFSPLRCYSGFRGVDLHRRRVKQVAIESQDLTDWWVPPAFKRVSPIEKKMRFEPADIIEKVICVNNRTKITLQSLPHVGGPSPLQLEQGVTTLATISFQPTLQFRQAEQVVAQLREFLVFALRRKDLYLDATFTLVAGNTKVRQMFRRSQGIQEPKPLLAPNEATFSGREIKYRMGATLKAWFDLAESYRAAMELCLADIESKAAQGELEFLALATSLEAFHQVSNPLQNPQTRSRWKYRERLEDLMHDIHPSVMELGLDVSRDAERLLHARDYYAHYMPDHNKKRSLPPEDLYEVTCIARAVLQTVIMKRLGLPLRIQKRQVEHNLGWQLVSLPGLR